MLFSLSSLSRYMAIVEGNVTIAAARRGLLQTAAEINYHRPRETWLSEALAEMQNLARIAQRPR